MRMPAFLTLSAVGALALATGCSVYDPSLIEGMEPGFCGYRPPLPPTGPFEPIEFEVVYALKDVQFEYGSRIGFDLDGVCTEQPDLETSCTPRGTLDPLEDGDRGRDNVFGQVIFPAVEVDVEGIDEASRESQEQGIGAIIVQVRDYNGTPQDDRVAVMLAVATFGTNESDAADVGFGPAPDFRPTLSDGSVPGRPAWSGGLDVFWARDDNFAGGDPAMPFVRADNAYVTNNMLVMNIPDNSTFAFPGMGTGLAVTLSKALLVGRFSDDLTQLQDVTIAGRWPMTQLVATAEQVGVCEGTVQRDILEDLLNDVADVRTDGVDDGTLQCDAISVTIRMQGYQARWPGSVSPARALTNACP